VKTRNHSLPGLQPVAIAAKEGRLGRASGELPQGSGDFARWTTPLGPKYVGRWERGEREPTGAFAARALRFLDSTGAAWAGDVMSRMVGMLFMQPNEAKRGTRHSCRIQSTGWIDVDGTLLP
jgi:hypothetical protein